MAHDSKSRRNVYSEVPLQLIPEQVAAEISSNVKASRNRKKEEAEEPIYLRRM